MFRIGTAPKLPVPGSIEEAVVDDERNAVLQYVGARGSVPNARAMLLTVGALQVPFDTHWASSADSPSASIIEIDSFGVSMTAKSSLGIGSTQFDSAQQEKEILMLAVEALLVFGRFFDGLSRADGEVLVNSGKLWRLSDFGYIGKGDPERVIDRHGRPAIPEGGHMHIGEAKDVREPHSASKWRLSDFGY